jgi:hypothetical protein
MEELVSYKIIDRVELAHTKVELRDDDIIQFFYGDNINYIMKETEELIDVTVKMTKGVVHKMLRIPGKFSNIDIEVMKYISRGRGTLYSLADSFVLFSMPQRILGNFYLRMNKPLVPTKLFNEVIEADKWLQSLDTEELRRVHKLRVAQFNQ